MDEIIHQKPTSLGYMTKKHDIYISLMVVGATIHRALTFCRPTRRCGYAHMPRPSGVPAVRKRSQHLKLLFAYMVIFQGGVETGPYLLPPRPLYTGSVYSGKKENFSLNCLCH